jgi:hypothetical protein
VVSARWFMPSASLAEAALVDGVQVQGASCSKTYSAGCGAPPLARLATAGRVAGSPRPRRCTRTGGCGPPATGKTMLVHGMVGLLPALTGTETLEVTAVRSVAGLLAPGTPLITTPPFVAPHHTSSVDALVGGGCGLAKPGTVSQAHVETRKLHHRLGSQRRSITTSTADAGRTGPPRAANWSINQGASRGPFRRRWPWVWGNLMQGLRCGEGAPMPRCGAGFGHPIRVEVRSAAMTSRSRDTVNRPGDLTECVAQRTQTASDYRAWVSGADQRHSLTVSPTRGG